MFEPFRCFHQRQYPEWILLNRSQHQHDDRGDNRDRVTSARQAAEALFSPKKQVSEQSTREALSPAGELLRKPRVLAISSTEPGHHKEVGLPIGPKEDPTPEIPRSQFSRIRAWVRYGMTPSQVAEVFGVAVGEIERILLRS
jgi:hypothetical protein